MTIKRNMDVFWNYEGLTGPNHWHELCEWYADGAKFPLQSPIALAKKLSFTSSDLLTLNYVSEKFTEKEFKNTIHFLPYDTRSFLIFEGVEYHLTDIHFHLPSEHSIDGNFYDLEIHLVHTNDKNENLVLASLFNLIDKDCKAEDIPDSTWDFLKHEEWFNPSIFLPERKSYFNYLGSLTTPPTFGPVQWFVFDQVRNMPKAYINLFKEEILENNHRPLQDGKNRKVFYYGAR
jgi:Carbonic anhydrase